MAATSLVVLDASDAGDSSTTSRHRQSLMLKALPLTTAEALYRIPGLGRRTGARRS
jgi:hypothetical protein